MSSHYSSVLAALDGSLQTIQSQLDRLQAAVEVDDDKLRITLTEANQQAAKLRDLIRVERPDADWKDRTALDQLLHELEIASSARLDQQQRAKMLALANELDAGRAQHRFDSRTTTLNRSRLEAVQLLRAEAAQNEQVKDLPGPNANEWLHWACNLRDEKDGFVLTALRRDFGAVEQFISEMEESYWIPGEPVHEGSGYSELSIPPGQEFVTESGTSSYSMADVPAGAKQGRTDEQRTGALFLSEADPEGQLQISAVTSSESVIAEPAERTTIDPAQQPAEPDFEVSNVPIPRFLSAAVQAPPAVGERILSTKGVITWMVVAGLFVAVGIFAFANYFHARTQIKSYGTVTGAGVKVDDTVQDSEIQEDIQRRLATLKASSIQVTVRDGVATLSGQSSSEEEVHAITLALQAKGVKDVRSELQIQAPNPNPQASGAKSP